MDAEEIDYYDIDGDIDFKGATWKWLDVDDVEDEPLENYFEYVCKAIDETRAAGKAVLVHCVAGMSRSPTLVAAYLMWHYKWTAAQALAHLKERRSAVDPNEGFRRQLLNWEQTLMLCEPKIDIGQPHV